MFYVTVNFNVLVYQACNSVFCCKSMVKIHKLAAENKPAKKQCIIMIVLVIRL